MKSKYAAVAIAALLLGATSVAFAEDATTTGTTTGTTTTTPPVITPVPPVIRGEMVLEVGPKGRALIRGNIESVGVDYVMIKSWGGLWKIKVASGTEIIPRLLGNTTDLAKFAVGDYVGAQGTISTTENWTINATVVRDRTEHKEMKEERKNNEKELHDKQKEDRKNEQEKRKEERKQEPQNHEGTIGAISGSAFTFVKEGNTYTVTTGSSTKFVNRNWSTIAFSDLLAGDKVRVYGSVSSTTLAAEVLRDLSVPR